MAHRSFDVDPPSFAILKLTASQGMLELSRTQGQGTPKPMIMV